MLGGEGRVGAVKVDGAILQKNVDFDIYVLEMKSFYFEVLMQRCNISSLTFDCDH